MRNTLLGLTILACACSDDNGAVPDAPITPDAPPANTGPINAPAGVWTFVPVDGNACDDGSATGIGVNPGDTDKLVVYFEGGGACGDYVTCYVLNTASHGPFGAAQLPGATNRPGSIFDRGAPDNPFAAFTLVYVPYCTGDIHGGVKINEYSNGQMTRTYHHVGHANAVAALERLAATWPSLGTLVVTGASAGGYGSVLNYDDYRSAWGSAKAYLIDDSGPFLKAASTPDLLKNWFVAWGLLDWIPCSECATEYSAVYPYLAGKYTSDRLALLSSLQDVVIRTYFFLDADQFQIALEALATDVLDPLPKFEHFFVAGDSHTMIGNPADFSVGELGLWTWLTQMVTDDAAWTSAEPN